MKRLFFILAVLLSISGMLSAATIFSDDFESGALGSGWSTYKTANGRVQVTTGTPYAGSYSMKLDCSTSGTFSYAAGILSVDLTGYTGSSLEFYWREYGDEDHDGDGVFVSQDGGSTWTKLLSFNGGPSTYKKETISLSAYDGKSIKIKFQFYDNWNMTSDGYAIDNVVVTGTASSGTTGSTGTTATWQSETKSVSSANYPSDYPNSQDVTETFTKTGATKMRVHFSAFTTESGYDFVYILDGSGNTVATYDGSLGAFTSTEVDGDTIKVRFTSDGSVVKAGWQIDKVEYLASSGTTGSTGSTGTTGSTGGTVSTIFSDDFESGSLGSSWSTYKTDNGRIQVTTGTPYAGSYSMKLDCSTSGTFSYAAGILSVNLSGYTGSSLEFYWREYGDENHDGDGVFVSQDSGSTWTKLLSFNNGPSTYKQETIDLSAYDGKSIQIKFQYYDNWYMTSDGYAIDNVTVKGTASGSTGPVASSRSGMGAIPYSGGVTFRVWAPNATAVAVAGDFNSWSGTANAMASEGNGYWSVDVSGAAAEQQYKFVITYNGNQLWKNDPYAREVTSSVGNSIIKDRSYTWSSFSMPTWGEMVIYELHVKTWNGTFAGVANKVSYLKDSLSVNAIELMPVHEFPGDQSWGYNPAHLFAVEASYGGYSAYKNMVNTLHQNGIAVIQDVVHNHYGPSDLDLWCFDGPDLGNGGIYFFTDYRKSTPWGDTRPDYGRGEVRSFIKDNAIYWLEEMQADGLRWDATVYIRKTAYDGSDISDGWSLLQWVHNEKNSRFSWKFSIAEDLQNDDYVTKTTGEGGAGFDSQWDANFLHKMRDQMKLGNDSDRDMSVIAGIIAKIDNGNATRLVKYSESHDECAGVNGKQRLIQDIDNYDARSYWAKKRGGLALLTAILSPGVPMIFQGQENLETGNWHDDINFNWSDTGTYSGYVQMVRDAVRMKRNWYNNTRGLRGNGINVHHVNNTGKVIAFHRWENGGDGDDVIVVINYGNTQYSSYNVGAPSTGTWYCRYNSDWNGYDSGFGNYGGYNTTAYSGSKDGMGNNMNVAIGGYSVLIFSK